MDLNKKLSDLTLGDLLMLFNRISMLATKKEFEAFTGGKQPAEEKPDAPPPVKPSAPVEETPPPPPAPPKEEKPKPPKTEPKKPDVPTKPKLPSEVYGKFEDIWFDRTKKEAGKALLKELDAEGVIKTASIVLRKCKDYDPDRPVEEIRSLLEIWIDGWAN